MKKVLSEVDEQIGELQKMFNISQAKHQAHTKKVSGDVSGDGWTAYALLNYHTKYDCQVYEFVVGDKDVIVNDHIHNDSTETIIPLLKSCIVNEEEIKVGGSIIIPPNTKHKCCFKANSKAIIVLQPIEKAYLIDQEG